MSISFNSVPSNLRLPFVTAEFDPSKASQGPALLAFRALLIGQKLASGSQAANTIAKITNPDQLVALAGRGSMLHRMALAWFGVNTTTELWVGFLADNGAGVAASGTITFTAAATAAGTVCLYLGGERITVGVNAGDAVATMATATAAAINAKTDLPVTASPSAGVVTVTFRHKGAVGNSYDMRLNYRDGEALPAGVAVTIVAMASGATNPTLTSLIAALGDTWFQVIAHPYTDATSLTAIENELESRAGAPRMIEGLAITSASGSHATLTSLGGGRNGKYSTIQGQPGPTPLTPPMEFAAETAALAALYGNQDPARPFQTLAYKRALPPPDSALFTNSERNLQLFDGIATSKVVGGVVQMERLITTYQTNSAGSDDVAYLDATTILTLMYLRYSWRARIASKYPRHKLADDGARFGPGQAVMTRKLGKAEALAWFRDMEELGLVEGYDQFKQDLVVERNATDRNRLDWLLPPDLINQLVVSAAKIQFRL